MIGKNNNAYIIKGDVIFETDGLIPKENILGVITEIYRKAKRVKFGLGPERFIIGLLSRIKILNFCFWCWMLLPFSARGL